MRVSNSRTINEHHAQRHITTKKSDIQIAVGHGKGSIVWSPFLVRTRCASEEEVNLADTQTARREYLALVASFLVVFLEGIIRGITLLLRK